MKIIKILNGEKVTVTEKRYGLEIFPNNKFLHSFLYIHLEDEKND